MDVHVGFFDLIKLGNRLVNHKILQYRLRTNETIERDTNNGKVKGLKRKTVYDQFYYAFEGIPYGKPPLGELRFRAPQPAEPWQGVLDCTNYRSKPLQKHFVLGITEGSEDCLYLNVYVKNLQTEKPLPVIVWIYGGGFQIGEATRDLYSPDYFMEKEVILVTFNYRIGALGFLSLHDPDLQVPGNAGLKDQVLALQWIKENIQKFNGDANNITVCGESAGAASTHFLLNSSKAKGLFNKAILQSGCVFSPWSNIPHNNWGLRLAQRLGYKGSNNDKEIFRFLSKVDGKQIVANDTSKLLTEEEGRKNYVLTFGPVIEPYDSESCITSRSHIEVMKQAWGNDLPILIGCNSTEGLFSYQDVIRHPQHLNELGNCEAILPNDLRKNLTPEQLTEMGKRLKQAHFENQEPSYPDGLFNYLELLGYRNFWHGMLRTILSRSAYAPSSPTYMYRFDFDSPVFNHYRVLKCGKNVRGVSHADDISYLFYHIGSWKLDKNSAEYKTIERMIGMWTAFAATSNPNCEAIKPAVWEPIQSSDLQTFKGLNISYEVKMIEPPESEKLKVWNSLYETDELF